MSDYLLLLERKMDDISQSFSRNLAITLFGWVAFSTKATWGILMRTVAKFQPRRG